MVDDLLGNVDPLVMPELQQLVDAGVRGGDALAGRLLVASELDGQDAGALLLPGDVLGECRLDAVRLILEAAAAVRGQLPVDLGELLSHVLGDQRQPLAHFVDFAPTPTSYRGRITHFHSARMTVSAATTAQTLMIQLSRSG